ncbi:MAG: IS256 family transposase [Planctomycetaceae bacterium]|nr:IS256 family transposase [Planctomycetaceae bacterium]
MSKTTRATHTTPVDEPLDSEVLEFRANFETRSPLDEIIREGARRMLQTAIDAEVDEFISQHAGRCDEQGRRRVVRNGRLPSREILSGARPLEVSQPLVRDKSPRREERGTFSPSVLPRYLRRTKAIEELIPWLYLKGISTGDFSEALQSLVGEQAKGLSANVIVRLKEQWTSEYDVWSRRDLSDEQYVYVWADGIHVNVRLEDNANKRQCILVLMGATAEGRKELIALQDGYRESKQCWRELLLDVQQRGLTLAPKLAIGDGALGFWAALREVFGKTAEQRCWFHKSGNVLSKLPKSVQPRAKSDLHNIWQAETRETANDAFDYFLEKYDAKYPAACECLRKDRDVLFTFYGFPAKHWAYIRTTNKDTPSSTESSRKTPPEIKSQNTTFDNYSGRPGLHGYSYHVDQVFKGRPSITDLNHMT